MVKWPKNAGIVVCPQDRLPGPGADPVVQADERGCRRVECGDHGGWLGAVREGIEPVSGDDRIGGARALPAAVSQAVAPDTLAWSESTARADGGQGADQIAADDERQGHRRRVSPGPDEGVGRL